MKVKGLSQALKNLDKASKEVRRSVANELEASAQRIRTEALRRVPVNMGGLRASITIVPMSNDIGQEVVVNSKYAPYVEFGTKSKVRIPAGLEQYASQFRGGGGSFKDLLKNIEAWANAKGIPEEAVYPIAIKIAREGVKAQPFLFPSVERERPQLLKRLKKVLKDVGK